MFLLKGTTKCIFDFVYSFSDYGVLIKFVFTECWDYRQIAFNSDSVLVCSERDLYLGEEQVAALGMESVIRFIFLDPIVVNQPASLKGEAVFLFILELNDLKVQNHLHFCILSPDHFSYKNSCWSVLDFAEHFS